jgi:hypothetical protein
LLKIKLKKKWKWKTQFMQLKWKVIRENQKSKIPNTQIKFKKLSRKKERKKYRKKKNMQIK